MSQLKIYHNLINKRMHKVKQKFNISDEQIKICNDQQYLSLTYSLIYNIFCIYLLDQHYLSLLISLMKS